jgi:hypothetical protein
MARNTITGKNKRKGSNKATGRDYSKQKKYNATKAQKKYRAELNKYNRKKGTYGNKDGKDASHKGGKIAGFESQSRNRARKATKKKRTKKNYR